MKKLVLICTLLFAIPAFAGDAVYTSFFSSNAVGGYDVVTYFVDGEPKKGNKKFKTKNT